MKHHTDIDSIAVLIRMLQDESDSGSAIIEDTAIDYGSWRSVITVSYRHVPTCGECGELRPDDARVQDGMKCGQCAYAS